MRRYRSIPSGSTLHTNSAAKTIDRVINVFPAEQQESVRGVLAGVLRGVLAQQLLRRKKGGPAAALDILFGSTALGSLVREGKTHQVPGLILQGKSQGMVSMDDSLRALVVGDVIEPHAALEKAPDKDEMRKWLKERGAAVAEE